MGLLLFAAPCILTALYNTKCLDDTSWISSMFANPVAIIKTFGRVALFKYSPETSKPDDLKIPHLSFLPPVLLKPLPPHPELLWHSFIDNVLDLATIEGAEAAAAAAETADKT